MGAALGSGVYGTRPSTQPRPPSALCNTGYPKLELQSFGTLRVNKKTIPLLTLHWQEAKLGWVLLGEPLPQAELPSHVPEGGHRLVLSLSEGGPGAAVTGSTHGPAVPMETLAAQQPHWLLLMSGGQLLFPWVFWAGSWGQGQGGGW